MASYMLPEIVLFNEVNFAGESFRTNLGGNLSGVFNDKISSVIVVSGTWQFFRHANFQSDPGDSVWQLGPGLYKFLPEAGIPNDQITSLKVAADAP